MAQNKISRRSFLRGAGASATIAAASCMAPSAAACDIKSLWSMDLQILATSDTHGKFDPWDYAANRFFITKIPALLLDTLSLI